MEVLIGMLFPFGIITLLILSAVPPVQIPCEQGLRAYEIVFRLKCLGKLTRMRERRSESAWEPAG